MQQSAPSSALFLLPSAALQVSAGLGTGRHRHVAAQILVALEGKLALRPAPQSALVHCAAVLVPPNVFHQIVGPGPLALMMWFDPATPQARAMRSRVQAEPGADVGLIQQQDLARCLPMARHLALPPQNCSAALHILNTVSQSLLPEVSSLPPLDSRITATLLAIQAPSLLEKSHPLLYLAQGVGLSESRLRHLFRQELGVPLQQYWIFHRLVVAIRRLDSFEGLTQIAHDAGFADLAHFSRAFRAAFGITPSLAQQNSRFVQVIHCKS